jgi:hypothetical protein
MEASARVIGTKGAKVVVQLHWREGTVPQENDLFQVLTLRGGKITHMQDFRKRGQALKALR